MKKSKNNIIKYSQAQKMNMVDIPKDCPNCNRMWKPELHATIIREVFFTLIKMAELHTKTCEWCGFEFEYYA